MKAAFIVGRFNPLTRIHCDLIRKLFVFSPEFKPFIFIVDGEKSSLDKDRNPLSANERKQAIREFFPTVKVDIVNTPYEVFDILEVQGYEPSVWLTGSDRVESYKKMIEPFNKECNFVSIQRDNLSNEDISATKARKAARSNDTRLFMQLMPEMASEEYIMNTMNKIRNSLKE